MYGSIHKSYKDLQKGLSANNPKRYGKNLVKKGIGNELDFLALDKYGNLLLIELKHGTNTSGIYLSPLQIGLYFDIFDKFSWKELKNSVSQMIDQKKKIGLINSKWKIPEIKRLVPVLVISEFNKNGSAKEKFNEVLEFARDLKGSSFLQDIKAYNYTTEDGLTSW